MAEFQGGFKRMVAEFGASRVDLAVTRAIDNVPDFVPTVATIRKYVPARQGNQFESCGKNGCQDGWLPATYKGEKAVIRCQCYHDWAGKTG